MRRRGVSRDGARESVEEYLETLSRLSEKGEPLSTGKIASELGVSPSSVSEMLSKLEREGYLKRNPYREVSLTAKGRAAGKKVLGRHRLLERFLVDLGFPQAKVHGEACRLEHHVSGDLEEVIRKGVRHSSANATKGVLSLAEMAQGSEGKVISVDGGRAAAARLRDMGLTPGTTVKMMRSVPFSGPVEVCVRDSCLVVGRGMAKKVLVGVD